MDNNVRLSDEELIQFRMFQEQMNAAKRSEPYFEPPKLSKKELRKSSYVRKTLSSDEYIAKVAILHPFAYFQPFALFVIAILALYAKHITDLPDGTNRIFQYNGAFAWCCLFIAFCKYLKLRMTEMVVTTKRVICKTGIIGVNTEELKNTRIESVEIKQTLWQRLWRYADIYFTGTGVSYVLFTNIRDARSVKSILEDNLDI
ncbi:MAG: PH domain-containing protein [Alphaproteobacteria bacterium]|nr:PH domain-containing protein [Alphaproteobacteria bacterium]